MAVKEYQIIQLVGIGDQCLSRSSDQVDLEILVRTQSLVTKETGRTEKRYQRQQISERTL